MNGNFLASNGSFVTLCVENVMYMKQQVRAFNPQYPSGQDSRIAWYKMMPTGWDICADPDLTTRLEMALVALVEQLQIDMFQRREQGHEQITG